MGTCLGMQVSLGHLGDSVELVRLRIVLLLSQTSVGAMQAGLAVPSLTAAFLVWSFSCHRIRECFGLGETLKII